MCVCVCIKSQIRLTTVSFTLRPAKKKKRVFTFAFSFQVATFEKVLFISTFRSNGGMGDQALMHDSECPSQALCDVVGETSLQESFPGKVKKIEVRRTSWES